MSDLFPMAMGAHLQGNCRYSLWRIWNDKLPRAAWLMCNPSIANDVEDDPTLRRCIHFSRTHGLGGLFIVNIWPFRTPYPEKLWEGLARGDFDKETQGQNLEAIAAAADMATVRFAAFGAAPFRKYPRTVKMALAFFERSPSRLLCLGKTDDGMPLHPLARGKFAIRNETMGQPWELPKG